MEFMALGDTPYDDSCPTCNTCIEDGQAVEDCTIHDCTISNSDMDTLAINNTCTFEGDEYDCLTSRILPYIDMKMDAGDAAFTVHMGDILKGDGNGGSRRCQESSYMSRRALFGNLDNFLLSPGDNEWNEVCDNVLYNLSSTIDIQTSHYLSSSCPR